MLLEPPVGRQLYDTAVLCAACGCDHLDCHGGPFLVVLVVSLNVNTRTVMQAQNFYFFNTKL
jgi:hypothetical protein